MKTEKKINTIIIPQVTSSYGMLKQLRYALRCKQQTESPYNGQRKLWHPSMFNPHIGLF